MGEERRVCVCVCLCGDDVTEVGSWMGGGDVQVRRMSLIIN